DGVAGGATRVDRGRPRRRRGRRAGAEGQPPRRGGPARGRRRRTRDDGPRADPSSDVGAERTGTNETRPPRPPRPCANRARPHRSRNRPPRNEEPRDHGRRLLSDHGGDAPDPARGCFLMEWRDRLQRIEAIVEKDLKVTKWWWIVAIIISATEFVAMTSVASNVRRMNDLYYIPFTWYDSNLRSLYAVSAFLASMILGLAFSQVHGGEIRRGTIRSIILYPVDMNDVTIAKLASSFVLATGFSTILFLGFAMPFFVYGVWPVGDFLAIHAMALLMAFLALATGVFLAHVVAPVLRRMIVCASLLSNAFLLASILLTETAANAIGLQFVAA